MTNIKLFSIKPVVKETREVIVPGYDYYLEKEEKIPGVIHIFESPVPRVNEWSCGFASISHYPKSNLIRVMPYEVKEIDQEVLLKIASFFGVRQVQIRRRYQRDLSLIEGVAREKIEAIQYSLPYNPESYDWKEDTETLSPIEGDLEINPVLCYGLTQFEDSQIFHTRLIAAS
jgi:hypothetical protein